MPSFKDKPLLVSDKNGSSQMAQSAHRPPPSDGSDIDHADPAFFVSDVSVLSSLDQGECSSDRHVASHKLILNKFNVHRPQYILLTRDPQRRQSDLLDNADLRAAWSVLHEVSTPHYVIYNCGREGGSSRKHKHMQVLEDLEAAQHNARSLAWPHTVPMIERLRADESATAGGIATLQTHTLPHLPYVHFLTALQASNSTRKLEQLLLAYREHVKRSHEVLGLGPFGETTADGTLGATNVPHNVVLTPSWILTIPRRKGTVGGIEGHIVNATGMLGLVWAGNHAQVEGWKRTGLAQVLRQLGVPSAEGCQRQG